MLQIGVAVYCLALWMGIVFGAHIPQTPAGFIALLIASAIVLFALAPRMTRILLACLANAPNAPPPAQSVPAVEPVRIPGAPGTPGAALARAPNVGAALA